MYTVKRLWIDDNEHLAGSVDVLAEMDDGMLWIARFVTLTHLQLEMEQSFEASQSLPDTPPVRYVTIETAHVVVQNLDIDTIEDTIDNLLALDVFESVFAPVSVEELTATVAAAGV